MKKYQQEYVDIRSIKYFLLQYSIENKPVVVYLHGGPGQSMIPLLVILIVVLILQQWCIMINVVQDVHN